MKNKVLTQIKSAACAGILLAGTVLMPGCTSKIKTEPYAPYMTSEAQANVSTNDTYKYLEYKDLTPEEIVNKLSLEQKASQMVLPSIVNVDDRMMNQNDYGGILSKKDSLRDMEWQKTVDWYQNAAVTSDAGIPYLYGQDDVHGVNYCRNSVIFPHNIGIGAANDPKLTYQMGVITAHEAELCHMLWNYSPVIAQSVDPRWGRTYESYGSDLELIKKLSVEYTKGLQDGGVVACPKHFFGDGNVIFGTGEDSDVDRLIDRGDAQLNDEQIAALLDVYQAQIDAGAQTIMISHSSVNGVKMHENGEYIRMLKEDMGFEGFIVSDWNSVQNTSADNYYDQVVNSVNAGIDMFMEVEVFNQTRQNIIDGVNNGDISEDRVNDAVRRIIKVKLEAGIFDDPFCENRKGTITETGTKEYRAVAETLVEESQVLVKNSKKILPLKQGTKVYITGPAADNASAQCGGWTIDWNSSPTKVVEGVTTILDGFKLKEAEGKIELITDPERAKEADVVLLCVGEQAYAEWNGDTEDMALCGKLGLEGNAEAIEEAKKLKKPTIALIVAGRNVIIDEYVDDWDGIVMSYLPGSEGQGVASVICGDAKFTGKLPSPWYASVDQIGTEECWHKAGYSAAK
jgi:beta-glucosidase